MLHAANTSIECCSSWPSILLPLHAARPSGRGGATSAPTPLALTHTLLQVLHVIRGQADPDAVALGRALQASLRPGGL